MIQRKNTSHILADSFIELMGDSSFEDISVQQITNNCTTSRQTFYKHFSDKYALTCWIYQEQVAAASNFLCDDWSWREAVIRKLRVFLDNAAFYQKIYRVDWFISAFAQLTNNRYQAIIESRLCGEPYTSEIEFAVDFFSYECVRKTAVWVTRGFRETPEALAACFEDCMPASMKRYLLKERSELCTCPAEKHKIG